MDEEEYYKKCSTPSTWFFSGVQLYNAAVILLDIWTDAINKPIPRIITPPTKGELEQAIEHIAKCCDLFPVYTLLIGHALENIAKGLEIMEKTKHGSPQASSPNLTVSSLGISDHETLKRLDRLKISLSPEERDAVQIAVDHVKWAGTYGVPKKPGEHFASEDMPIVIKERRKYADALNPLFNRLCSEFREKAFRYFGTIF